MEFTFSETLILIVTSVIGLVIGVFAIKVVIKFDINLWLENRQKRLREKFMGTCPHVEMGKDGEKRFVVTTFILLPGNSAFECQLCGNVMYDSNKIERDTKFWANNLDELKKREKEVAKIHKKMFGK